MPINSIGEDVNNRKISNKRSAVLVQLLRPYVLRRYCEHQIIRGKEVLYPLLPPKYEFIIKLNLTSFQVKLH